MRWRLPRVFHREADLQRHLEVAHLAVFDVSAGPRDLEPSQVSDGLVGALNRGFNRLIDAFLRRAHQFDDAINVPFAAMLRVFGVFRLMAKSIAPSRPVPASVFIAAPHFGRTVGSPPGLPGGGITGVLPPPGGASPISGSTPAGGQSTP